REPAHRAARRVAGRLHDPALEEEDVEERPQLGALQREPAHRDHALLAGDCGSLEGLADEQASVEVGTPRERRAEIVGHEILPPIAAPAADAASGGGYTRRGCAVAGRWA